jgi:hypothetical protein
MSTYYQEWIKKYPIVSIEDPFDQDDFDSYSKYIFSTRCECSFTSSPLVLSVVLNLPHTRFECIFQVHRRGR